VNDTESIDFSKIRAVAFDAGGTLIEPWPSVGHVYADAARIYLGAAPDPERLNSQFRDAWKSKPGFDYSRAAWLDLVKRSFSGICPDPEVFFESLYRRFGEPDTWHVHKDVFPTLQQLQATGRRLAVISNWDERLRPLLNRLGLAHFFEQIIVSIDAGYTKPAPQIFRQALEVLGLEPNEILHVGDSENEDVAGPQALGIPALLLSRGSREHGNGRVIGALTELTSLFQGR
jgi:putative hydrolase of the HAD superfamily